MHGDHRFKYLGFIAFRPVSTEFGAGDMNVSPLPPPLVAVAASSLHFATLGTPIASAVTVSSHKFSRDRVMGVQWEYVTISWLTCMLFGGGGGGSYFNCPVTIEGVHMAVLFWLVNIRTREFHFCNDSSNQG